MGTLALIFALSTGDVDLPLTLAAEPPARKNDYDLTLGPRIGVAKIYDSDDASFVAGAQARARIYPWLAAEASIDLQTQQTYENGDIDVQIFPFQLSGLFYPQVDWPVKPYGLVGVDLAIVDVHYKGAFSNKSDKTVIEPGAHFGFGADYALTTSITLDADFRFVWLAGTAATNRFDYFQFTVGVNFKLQ
jgi:opacity protein-like surface antigen